ncbi:hypothetical protein SARC_07707 [Sphaeroforma arctica JP610]|uniref:Plant heme peroxidase family profile domain-containing protein n=1 Tax=Sphaeroforma arctica JP610 TaxID=667725 RepID=A0A0L0FTL7_9EUKA|nr:hypothetical protein SARC_07707 [Sphaeroforma arctica JP610]KNC79916.1 hypothetical protein SARC_07707 [Sphaeroforma arctica JP610]|eukprot:XP_014153818.1 hypothetical protein SARC_07707 [Sphaeroforma arctica JP610]
MHYRQFFFAAVGAAHVSALCPHFAAQRTAAEHILQQKQHIRVARATDDYSGMDSYGDVMTDIAALLTDSQSSWPADFGNYGPFMIRLAWHCSGSYRTSDGRGGCAGARIRFGPEADWEDNANLDQARKPLESVKEKYGDDLSWGDLIVLTGNVAIESMGGPSLNFCGGRVDAEDGLESVPLGPSTYQEELASCEVNGQCEAPLGPTTIGLIYVNPEGPMGIPDSVGSAADIRSSFGRMGMNDRETVALIGGGHAFGKAHGACKSPPCGSGAMEGKGPNTFTSGFEGAWTNNPTKWDNAYFNNLVTYNWTKVDGPGGHVQWEAEELPGLMMLTSDIALINDEYYLPLVMEFATDQDALDKAFSDAWYKLTSRDMGPAARCKGDKVLYPPALFQNPLPKSQSDNVDFEEVNKMIKEIMYTESNALRPDRNAKGEPYYGAYFVTLAYQCASTFRTTDYSGGCNGASIRFQPQKFWPRNIDLDKVMDVLRPVEKQFKDLSWADLIVAAGHAALVDAGGLDLQFKGGRSDAINGDYAATSELRDYYLNPMIANEDNANVMGLTAEEFVALAARPRSASHEHTLGYVGSYTGNPSVLSNEYFQLLLNEDWVLVSDLENGYKAKSKGLYMEDYDLALLDDPDMKAAVEKFAMDEDAFMQAFTSAWEYLMNADRFA